MSLRCKFVRVHWNIMGILLFLACVFTCIPSHSLAQSLLPFRLVSREEKLEAFPCQSCHQDIPVEIGQESTKSQEHDRISLQHGGLRCLDCHDPENRDFLRTIDHRQVSFSNEEEVCGVCHAARYQDWKKGIHGKLTGSWNRGSQWGMRCAECHDVHKPKPVIFKPERPPQPPAAALTWSALP
jgi:hypothetical protein